MSADVCQLAAGARPVAWKVRMESPTPSSGPMLERFRVLRPLGKGGMGKVFEAEDRQCGARVALKMLSSLTPDSIQRFKEEFRALRDLHHPNLVRLGELLEQQGDWFFTMEVVDGLD